MKDYNKDKESSYLVYWDVNNLYGLAMSQKLSVENLNGKKTTKFDEGFMRNYNENSKKRYIFKVDVQYPKNLHNDNLHK